MEFLTQNLPLLLPIIILLQLIFQVFALIDVIKRKKEELRGDNKVI